MNKMPHFNKNLLSVLVAALFCPALTHAAPLSLSTLPPGTANNPPAPNVVITVDDSGSMNELVDQGKIFNAITNPKKIDGLKDALKSVFEDQVLIPPGKIRIAWQAMHNNGKSPGAGTINLGAVNSMKPLDADHRAKFLDFASKLKGGGGTPSHKMMSQAYDYMTAGKGINSPWAAAPTEKQLPYLGCRRAYHIFLTDGGWNGQTPSVRPGNIDNTDRVLPDGKLYSTSSEQTNVYRGKSGNIPDLLADWSMKMWQEDLQPDIENIIEPSTTDGVAEFEKHGSVQLEKYWNPKHNPAKWQHLVQYTIGYGKGATDWTGEPLWSLTDDNYSGDYSGLVQGNINWGPTVFQNLNDKNPIELWHMAINSRGKFYPTGPGHAFDLTDVFGAIIEDINLQNVADVGSVSGSATTIIRDSLSTYTTGFSPDKWSGYVRSNTVSKEGLVTVNSAWGTTGTGDPNTTATLLDARAPDTRVILTSNDNVPNKGVSFEWETGTTKLSAVQKTALNAGGDGELRVNFLRGDRTKEGGVPTKPFRERASRQGDIINSSLWYVDAPASNYSFAGYKEFSSSLRDRLPMVYVGGNDGMLHGFSGVDGSEKIAYVPKAVIADLPKLGDTDYIHRYYVDGSPFTGDLNVADVGNPADWRTFLVGTLAAGGKGYFVLDVTQPGNKSGTITSTFQPGNAQSIVVMDRTLNAGQTIVSASDDEDIGHIFSTPVTNDSNPFKVDQIVLLNDNRWAVVLGNGYNSANERPVLLIQYLDNVNAVNGIKELKRIVATGTQTPSVPTAGNADTNVTGNGLSAPRLVDINSDGRMDVAYAGDLKGNMWKFDLTSATSTNWGVASWNSSNTVPCTIGLCAPFFTAINGGKRQPITSAPTVKANDRGVGGLMVAFGTGKNLTDDDRTNQDVQSVYSVLDNTKYRQIANKTVVINTNTAPKTPLNPDGGGSIPTTASLADMVKQKLDSSGIAGTGASAGRTFWKVSQNDVNFVDPSKPIKKGWYFDLEVPRERVLQQMSFFDSSNNLIIFSIAPAYGGNLTTNESCEPAGTPEKQYLTLMNIMDGKAPSVQVMDTNGDGVYNSVADNLTSRMSVSEGSNSVISSKDKVIVSGSDGKPNKLNIMPEQSLRPSWRQLR